MQHARSTLLASAFIASLHAAIAAAHHGNNEFDLRIESRYEGVVVDAQWKNPHSVLRLSTTTPDGEPDAWSPVTTPQSQCVPMSAPMLMAYPVALELSRASGHLRIRTDWMNAERTLYLDGRAHPSRDTRLPQGHSVGHWEGNVLVVDSTNFVDEVWAGLPTGVNKHLVERFALSADGKSIDYQFTLTDPDHLAQPVSGAGRLSHRPDLRVGGMECDRDAARRYLREFQ